MFKIGSWKSDGEPAHPTVYEEGVAPPKVLVHLEPDSVVAHRGEGPELTFTGGAHKTTRVGFGDNKQGLMVSSDFDDCAVPYTPPAEISKSPLPTNSKPQRQSLLGRLFGRK